MSSVEEILTYPEAPLVRRLKPFQVSANLATFQILSSPTLPLVFLLASKSCSPSIP